MNGLNLSSLVSTKNKYLYNQKPHSFIKTKFNESSDFIPNIVVIDFGVKKNILRNLVNINANVTILSEDTNIEAIKDYKSSWYFFI